MSQSTHNAKLSNALFEVLKHDIYTNEAISDMGVEILSRVGDTFNMRYQNKVYVALIKSFDTSERKYVVNVDGYDFTVKVKLPLDQVIEDLGFLKVSKTSVKEIKSPMPGLVVDVFVAKGQEVSEGDKLLSLEAMKMENILKAPSSGIVKEILVKRSTAVEKNQILITFE